MKIRFITPNYENLFEVEDGQEVKLTHSDGTEIVKPCKYIDDYHFYFGNTCYHICEFAEKVYRNSAKVSPII